MKEALFWRRLEKNIVQCQLCPHFCVIPPEKFGKCNIRKNINGKLFSLSYSHPVAIHLDPIEKKPLYHFLPGSQVLSIGTYGCNLNCLHCQNYDISKEFFDPTEPTKRTPEEIVSIAKRVNSPAIAYTYTEPTIFYEYALEISKLAKKQGIKNVIVSNGFINSEPLKKFAKYLDGANIDLKGFSEKFYKEECGGRLQPVLESLKILKSKKVWVEITNLIIPSLNDSSSQIKKLSKWILEELGPDTPLHFTAFYPTYKRTDLPPTPPEVLKRARKIALELGLHYVYTGNIYDPEGGSTFCPNCNTIVIRREGFKIYGEVKGKCEKCGRKISGVWG